MRRPPNFLSPVSERPGAAPRAFSLSLRPARLAAILLAGCFGLMPALAQNLQVVIVAGTQATNNIETGRMADVVVRVQDANQMPVSGASVSFVYPPNGPSGVFSSGERTRTQTTGADGTAGISGVSPEGGAGPLEIRISASYQGQTATATVNQTNIDVPAPRSGAGAAGSQSGQSSGVNRKKMWIVIAIAAAAAAGGIATAMAADGNNGSSSTPSTPTIVLTPGTPSVGGP